MLYWSTILLYLDKSLSLSRSLHPSLSLPHSTSLSLPPSVMSRFDLFPPARCSLQHLISFSSEDSQSNPQIIHTAFVPRPREGTPPSDRPVQQRGARTERSRAGPLRLDVRHSLVVRTSGTRAVMELSAAEFPESSSRDWTSGVVRLGTRGSPTVMKL